MGKVKRLTMDRYEHGLPVRVLYEEWQRMQTEGKPTDDIEGQSELPADDLGKFIATYEIILNTGKGENPIPERVPGTKGRIKKGKARALIERLAKYKEIPLRRGIWRVTFPEVVVRFRS